MNIMKQSFFRVIMLLSVFALFSHACMKEEYAFHKMAKTQWSPHMGFPIIKTKLNLEDVLKVVDTLDMLNEDEFGMLYITYRNTAYSQKASDVVVIPNQSLPSDFSFNVPGNGFAAFPSGNEHIETYLKELVFNMPNGEEIDDILLKSGDMQISGSGTLNYSAEIVISCDDISDPTGKTFQKIILYNHQGATPVTIDTTFDLSGYKVDFVGNGGNKLTVNYEITAYGDNNETVSSPYDMQITTTFSDLDFSVMYGYFGQQTIDFPYTELSIDLFKNVISGEFRLVDPVFRMYIKNSYGIPMRMYFDSLDTWNRNTLESEDIVKIPSVDYYVIDAPSEIGDTTLKIITYDPDNSNIDYAVNINPQYIRYSSHTDMNPEGKTTTQNFITDTSGVDVDIEMDIPLYGSIDAMKFDEDTMTDMPIFDGLSGVEFFAIWLEVSNSIPIEIGLQVYFVDSLNVKLDSLILTNNMLIPSGTVVGNIVTEPGYYEHKFEFSEARLEKLKDKVESIIITGLFNSPNNGNTDVKILSTAYVEVQLKIEVKADMKF